RCAKNIPHALQKWDRSDSMTKRLIASRQYCNSNLKNGEWCGIVRSLTLCFLTLVHSTLELTGYFDWCCSWMGKISSTLFLTSASITAERKRWPNANRGTHTYPIPIASTISAVSTTISLTCSPSRNSQAFRCRNVHRSFV